MTEDLAAGERSATESQHAWRSQSLARVASLWPLIAVLTVAAAVRLNGIDWGLPYIYHFDEPNNLIRTLTMLREGDPNPHWFHYGSLMFYSYGTVIAAGATLRSLSSGGSWASQLEYPEMIAAASGHMSDPWALLVTRYVSLALSVATVVVIYLAVRRLTRRHTAAVYAGLLFALAPIAVREGRLFSPNTLSGLFAATAISASIRIYERGDARDYVLAGAMVGLAAGAKYNAGLVGIAVLIAHALRARESAPTYQRGPLVSFYAALGVFFLTTPFAILDATEFLGDVGFELTHYSGGHIGSEGSGVFLLAFAAAFSTSLLVIPFGLLDRRYRSPAIIAVGFGLIYLLVFAVLETNFARNVLPALPAFCVAVGLGVSAGWDRFSDSSQVWKTGLAGLMIVSIAVAFAAVAYDYVDLEDRSDATEWITSNVPTGSTIVVDAYSPWVDPTSYSVVSVGFVADVDVHDDWDFLIITDRGSGRFEGLGIQGDRLAEIRSTTCLLRGFAGIEIRSPDCP